ncbi:MAG: glycoside hydrolase family 16 protein [Saprospiraceae bacterium]|nr:glycoside hydrolase family 16 protein [Saprospiraceae bacterium]
MRRTLVHIRSLACWLLLGSMIWTQQLGAQGLVYSTFADWPLVKLKGGMLVCTDWQTNDEAFIENFDDESVFDTRWDRLAGSDPLQGAFHGSSCDNIFVTNNVELVPVSPGSSDKILHLTTRQEDQPVTVPNFNNGLPGQGWPCLPPGLQTLESVFTGGAIHMKEPFKYNLGRYEIVLKMPLKNNVWSAFWMWHHDEIDIMDIAYYGKFLQNVFNAQGSTASLQDAPCCTHMAGCDFCDDIVDHIDCSGFANCGNCNEQNPQEVPYDCGYMADGAWHTVGCEWTPYKVMFYVDGVVTGTVYRYYYPDKTPVIIECGGTIPDAVVRENPAFPQIKERYFQPIVWIVPEGDDDCPGAGFCNEPGDLPATLQVKEISIRERAYQRVAITGCFDLCDAGDICLDFDFENLNGLYGTQFGVEHVEPVPDPNLSNCVVVSKGNGYGTVTDCGPEKICFTYNAEGCAKPEGCIGIRTELGYPAPMSNLSLIKWLTPQKPTVYSQCDGTSVVSRDKPAEPECVCVDPGTTCNLTVLSDGTATDISYEDGLTCFSVEGPCAPFEVLYEKCGEPQLDIYDIHNQNSVLNSILIPHLVLPEGSTPLNQGITYITNSTVTICYFSSDVQILHAQVTIDGNTYILSPTGDCITLTGIKSYANLTITILVEGCGTFTQYYTLINSRTPYKIAPNPSNGMAYLSIDRTPVDGGAQAGEILPQPEQLMLMDAGGNVIHTLDISSGNSRYPIDLNGRPAGSYQVLIKDGQVAEPLHFLIQKY